MSRSKAFRRSLGFISLLVAAAAWFFFAPQQVGGPVAYAVINGQSMEPSLRADDLVIVKRAPAYGIGDAIAYRSENLDRMVLHRVVARNGERFVTKGDNNDFLDGDSPAESDVVGKLWVHVPKAGMVFRYLRSPSGMGVGLIGVLAALGFFSTSVRRKRRAGRRAITREGALANVVAAPISPALVPAPPARPKTYRSPLKKLRVIAAAWMALLLIAAAAGVITRTWDPLIERSENVSYKHHGTFAYSAPAPRGPVYQEPTIATGDPVFVKLVDRLDVDFDYKLETNAAHEVGVTGEMLGVLRAEGGWERTIPLASETRIEDDALTLSGRIDLNRIRAVTKDVERLTGFAPGSYSLAVEPHIQTNGMIAGSEISDDFAPRLLLELDPIRLAIVREQDEKPGDFEKLLNPSTPASVKVRTMAPHPLTIAGREVQAEGLQKAATGTGIVALVGLLTTIIVMIRKRPRDEVAKIQARYGSLIIPVTDVPQLLRETVDVKDIDTLVRLAHQFEQPIMHREDVAGHSFLLYFDGLLYRYAIEETIEEFVEKTELRSAEA